MKTNGDCCMVALRKQHELLLQHITKLRLSDRPSQAEAAAGTAPGGEKNKNSLTPSTSPWFSVQ